jgi:HSP20 family molecular chaperone IbpA
VETIMQQTSKVPVKTEKKTAVSVRRPQSWQPFQALHQEIDRLFTDFGRGYSSLGFGGDLDFTPFGAGAQELTPAVDLVDKGTSFQLTAELPGLDEKNVEVLLADGVLTIKGEKSEENSFQRSFDLPKSVAQGKIEASFQKGFLTITMPKTEAARKSAKKIMSNDPTPISVIADLRATSERPVRWKPLVRLGTLLERERSDVAWLAHFARRVEDATFHLCIAFEKAEVRDFELSHPRDVVRSSHGVSTWYATLVNATFNRYRNLRKALVHHWTPPAEVELLTLQAFHVLCDLTPADSQLRYLLQRDRPRAFCELARHLDIVADQLKAAIQLAANLEPARADDDITEERVRLDKVQTEILEKAGETLSLTSAAARLGITRQALHKRIRTGSALGLMRGTELVVPAVQFVKRDSKLKVVGGLRKVVAVFDRAGAGRWSALQFLIEIDPLLKTTPLDALKRDETQAVIAAARGYLSVDEA